MYKSYKKKQLLRAYFIWGKNESRNTEVVDSKEKTTRIIKRLISVLKIWSNMHELIKRKCKFCINSKFIILVNLTNILMNLTSDINPYDEVKVELTELSL
ncbi:hypothetical protein HYD56_00895 [Mycoplasmopsis bovis]|nr:hypothetical protein [Mycoplasmopsis bovis]QQH66519.1 hypothetical protein HYD56_00895 [Mycoplasmopsis bovis]